MKRFLLGILAVLFLFAPVTFAVNVETATQEVMDPVPLVDNGTNPLFIELAWDDGPAWSFPFRTGAILYHAVWFDVVEMAGLSYPVNLNNVNVYLPDGYFGQFFITYEDLNGAPDLMSITYDGWIWNEDTEWAWVNGFEEIDIEITQPFFIVFEGYDDYRIAGDLGDQEGGEFQDASITYMFDGLSWEWYFIIWYYNDDNGEEVWIGKSDYCFRALVTPSSSIADNLPTDYILSLTNYPNPFNAQTNIAFELTQGGNVSIDVYNLLGQRVDRVNAGTFIGGQHTITYNASQLTTGIYFYTLNINGVKIATRKFNLLK